ncbi:hypothetical protein ACQB60_45505 [Actinomycetota bacterium Odt1-20B]
MSVPTGKWFARLSQRALQMNNRAQQQQVLARQMRKDLRTMRAKAASWNLAHPELPGRGRR